MRGRVHRLIDQPVVLGVEDRVDRGEADVLVHAAVAGDVVRVQQFVVVGSRCRRLPFPTLVSASARLDAARIDHRHCVVRDVDQELVAGAHRVRQIDRRGGLPSTRTVVRRCPAMPSASRSSRPVAGRVRP